MTELPSRRARLVAPLALVAGLTAAAAMLRWRDPHRVGAWGRCPTLYLTHLACPFCGGLRAVNDLTHADVAAAFHSNAVFVLALPLVAVWWLAVLRDRWRGTPRPWNWLLLDPRVMRGLVVVLVLFTIVRNLPVGRALYP